MKLKRLLLIFLVLVVGLFFAAIAFVDTLARQGIETGGTYALGVPTKLKTAKVGLLSGEFTLTGLSIANPEGFKGEHILTLHEGELEVSLPSLLKDQIIAPRLVLTGISMLLQKGPGGMNYSILMDNLERLKSSDTDPGTGGEEESTDGEKRFVFDEIILRDITTAVDLFGEGEISTATVKIPEVVIKDLGRRPMTMSEVFQLVFESLLEASLKFGDKLMPAQLLTDLQGRLEGVSDDLYDKAEDKLDELVDKLGPEAAQALEGVLDKAKGELDKGIRDLFRKKKN
jgi:hypothetical protein